MTSGGENFERDAEIFSAGKIAEFTKFAGDTENRNSRKTRPFYSICQLAAGRSFH